MNHSYDFVFVENFLKEVCLEQITFNEIGTFSNRIQMPFAQVIKDGDFMFCVQQFFCDDTSDIAGAARDENAHQKTLLSGDKVIRLLNNVEPQSESEDVFNHRIENM